MNTIDRQELKKRLLKDGYIEAFGLENTIDNLINLDGKAKEMLVQWLKYEIIPEFEAIEGIDSKMLRGQLNMKEPAIILSYGMLLKNPKVNSVHLKNLFRNRMYNILNNERI